MDLKFGFFFGVEDSVIIECCFINLLFLFFYFLLIYVNCVFYIEKSWNLLEEKDWRIYIFYCWYMRVFFLCECVWKLGYWKEDLNWINMFKVINVLILGRFLEFIFDKKWLMDVLLIKMFMCCYFIECL